MIEKLLGLFEGAQEDTRIELVQLAKPGERPTLELRLQRECGDLGWSTQRRVEFAPGQWAALRDALNMADLDVREDRAPARHAEGDAPRLRLIG